MKAVTIAVINHKGGTAKTTSAVNLAASLAKTGKKVLAIDLDVQTNLTHWLCGDSPEGDPTIAESILDKNVPIKSIIKQTQTPNLDVAPAGESMVDLELKLHSAYGREFLLKRALQNCLEEYDYIIMDNAPAIGLTTVNALVASDYYLVPVSAEYLPLVGIKKLLATIEQIRPLNEGLRNLGYLVTMLDKREGISGDVEKILRENFKAEVLSTVIRVNTKLKALPQKKLTVFDIEKPSGKSFQDYLNAGKEIMERVEAFGGA